MGYRLGIYKTETIFYGTKLYGYVDSIEDFIKCLQHLAYEDNSETKGKEE